MINFFDQDKSSKDEIVEIVNEVVVEEASEFFVDEDFATADESEIDWSTL